MKRRHVVCNTLEIAVTKKLTEMMTKIKELNASENLEKSSKILILISIFLLITIFAKYYQTKMNLQNPLIPKYLAFEIFNPYSQKGFVLTVGLFFSLSAKFLKQNLISVIICIIIIAIYFLTSFEPNFTEYK